MSSKHLGADFNFAWPTGGDRRDGPRGRGQHHLPARHRAARRRRTSGAQKLIEDYKARFANPYIGRRARLHRRRDRAARDAAEAHHRARDPAHQARAGSEAQARQHPALTSALVIRHMIPARVRGARSRGRRRRAKVQMRWGIAVVAALVLSLVPVSGASAFTMNVLKAAPDDPTAGAHSNFTVDLAFDGQANDADAQPRDLIIDLPAGLIGNANATTKCSIADFNADNCTDDQRVGTVSTKAKGLGFIDVDAPGTVYNLQSAGNEPARLGHQADPDPAARHGHPDPDPDPLGVADHGAHDGRLRADLDRQRAAEHVPAALRAPRREDADAVAVRAARQRQGVHVEPDDLHAGGHARAGDRLQRRDGQRRERRSTRRAAIPFRSTRR